MRRGCCVSWRRARKHLRQYAALCVLSAVCVLGLHLGLQAMSVTDSMELVQQQHEQQQIAISEPRAPAVHMHNATWCQLRKLSLSHGDAVHGRGSLTSLDLEPSEVKVTQTCQPPVLDPCHPDILEFDHWVPPVTCAADQNWVYVDNGTFRISAAARRQHGEVVCEYEPLARGDDFSVKPKPHVKPMLDGALLHTDYFMVACESVSGARYHNIHLGVAYDPEVHARLAATPLSDGALGYNVLILGFDSVSMMSMYRNMPRTVDFLVNSLGVVELEGYNIVGDGTDKALLPLLTGFTELELPSAIRGQSDRTVDDFPWLWGDFRRAGYVTGWAEDMAYVGTFQYRYNGFRSAPVDHYPRSYYLHAEHSMNKRFQPFCLGSTPRIQRMTDWVDGLFTMYPSRPKFTFAFHSENSHDDNNNLKAIDSHVVRFLRSLHRRGGLDRTLLVVMSDHGARFAGIRSTEQGKLEERNPFFSFYFPPDFRHRHSQVYKTFVDNRRRLTTPFDIHETLHDLLNFTHVGRADVQARGISLFSPIPASRSCADAGIDPQWCACLDWVDVTSEQHPDLIRAVIDFLNDVTRDVSDLCARLSVKVIQSVKRMRVNSNVLKFKGSKTADGHLPDMSDDMTRDFDHFQVTLMTSPGDGMFEVTAVRSVASGEFSLSERTISRINRYGDDPACVAARLPHLRAFCYCV